MILITGAAGKTGQAIIGALQRQGERVRALVHRREQQPMVLAAGASDVVVADLQDVDALVAAMQGVRGLYHICPNMHPHEEAIGAAVIRAAQAARVGHLVYHSVLCPQTRAMPHHWQKLLVEERILQSGLAFTVLQPTAYMQNLLSYWPVLRQRGQLAMPYPPTTRIALVDLADVAAAAALVLTQPGHQGAIYPLAGTMALSQSQVAGVLAEGLGCAVTALEIPLVEWEAGARRAGLDDYAIDTLRAMFRYYADYGLVGNPNVLRWLLGRPPTTLAAFVRRHAARDAG